jgi:hypothetical protein
MSIHLYYRELIFDVKRQEAKDNSLDGNFPQRNDTHGHRTIHLGHRLIANPAARRHSALFFRREMSPVTITEVGDVAGPICAFTENFQIYRNFFI